MIVFGKEVGAGLVGAEMKLGGLVLAVTPTGGEERFIESVFGEVGGAV